ncbi:MAG: short-chain dehydrogenase/reductase [Acidimicrobiaceae bacterium]|jgi:3-oxoacyl-[acyl-carrier protein] reductase|nr:short-chain dehydrogenase/reductase [Acidimicrobiaceae bacterium]
MDLQLTGLRVLVTGGTKGIGRAIVETFLDEGAAVAFCARNADEIVATEKSLAERGVAFGTALDVADTPALTEWVGLSATRLGGIDIVVSNVSAMVTADTAENWARCFEIDVMAAVNLVNASLGYLEASEAASIVTVSSVSGREIDVFAGPYGAMKAGLVHYTQGLAYQLAPKGIRANTVSPGNTFFEGGSWDNIQRNAPDLYATTLGLNPMGRLGTPEEMARAVVFLASRASSFTTGTNLVVDGALTRGVQL